MYIVCEDGFFGVNCGIKCFEMYFGLFCGFMCSCFIDKCYYIIGC